MQDYTITRSNVESYKLRHKSGMYWADITIDSNEKAGRIQIASDFGNWQYYFGSCGESFKDFLCSLERGYAASKFGEAKHFMLDETIKSYKISVIESRRTLQIEADLAKILWRDIEKLDSSGEDGFYLTMMSECDALFKFFDYTPSTITGISPAFEKFWTMVWPVFVQHLKAEKQVA